MNIKNVSSRQLYEVLEKYKNLLKIHNYLKNFHKATDTVSKYRKHNAKKKTIF